LVFVPAWGPRVWGSVGPMAILRFIAFLLIVSGLMLLGADVVSMLETGEPKMRSIQAIWDLFVQGGAEGFVGWAQTSMPAPLPEGIATILSWPAWACAGVLGVLLAILFRQREDVYD
jgi:hypothetical protein